MFYIYIYVYVFYGSCAMRFGSCLDFVIGSCGSFALAFMLQSFDFHVCLLLSVCLELSTIMFMNNVLQNPCNAGMV